ncbi:cytoplasmic tRNA 2-thiolation protein 1 [Indicator indicator]|uniref:cytoplasmic tRNA 2-thiolation protein 1 n=1 Tax=Indicator indicator TaxID=1002788 RepID=UPI0023DEECDD|nr:cytoplasmic tRNA 2-thiolation protein 1 [Indicator indicator]
MPAPRCRRCPLAAALRRPRTSEPLCRRCFLQAFEDEAFQTPSPGSSVAIAASGGKDSSVLAHLLARLNGRLGGGAGEGRGVASGGRGYRFLLLSVDEGIAGYREAALGAVRGARGGLPLLLLSHRQLFGWSVDELGAAGLARGGSRCTFCGVFRRQALERGARALGVDWIATGHNADDIAETLLMNLLRGDVARLRRAASEATRKPPGATTVPRLKPLRHCYEKEIVLYAHYQGLTYVSTECLYAPHAFRGHPRGLLKELEATRSSSVAALGHSSRALAVASQVASKGLGACGRCGFASSQGLCKACVLLAALEKGRPKVGLGKRGEPSPGPGCR